MIVEKGYQYSAITGAIIGSAMQVHSIIGVGYPEIIYQRALAIQMAKNNLDFNRELSIPLSYNDKNIGYRRVDFLVENKIIVELKAISDLENKHIVQGLNYLTIFNIAIGLLINFGNTRLQFNRLINSNYKLTH